MSFRFSGTSYSQLPHGLDQGEGWVSDRAYRLYGRLHSYTRPDKAVAWPGLDTLAEWLRCHPDTVRRAIKELADAGWITIEERFDPDTGAQRSNRYVLYGARVTDEPPPPNPREVAPRTHATLPLASTRPEEEEEEEQEVEEEELSTRGADLTHWDALVSVFGRPTNGTRSLYGRMVRDLAAWHPSEIPRRAAALALEWGPSRLTPASLEKHWSRYEPGKPGSLTEDDLWEARQRQKAEAAARLELE